MVARTGPARKRVGDGVADLWRRARIRRPASCMGPARTRFRARLEVHGSAPIDRRRAGGGRARRALGHSRRHDGGRKNLGRQAAGGETRIAVRRRRRGDRSGRPTDHFRDLRAVRRGFLPRRGAQGDRAPAQRRPAGAGDRRRRVHERRHARQYRQTRRLDLAEAEFRRSAGPGAQEVPSAAVEDARPGTDAAPAARRAVADLCACGFHHRIAGRRPRFGGRRYPPAARCDAGQGFRSLAAAGEAPGGGSARRARLLDPDRAGRPRRGGR